jgi:uncharacterized protein (DUF1015 family)
MAEIRPFRALRFNPQKISSYDDVITPPFDVIDDQTREQLAARSPYNTVHLILPQDAMEKDRYAVAADLLEQHLQEGALAQDEEPSFYLLTQEFQGLDGTTRTRRGFFGVIKLPEPGEKGVVLGHEKTFPHKVKDRLALTSAAKANLGSVFLLYDDPEKQLRAFLHQAEQREPDMTARTADGVTQRLWKVPGDESVTAFFQDKTLYIADGHHRFLTAVTYRDEMRREHPSPGLKPWDYALMGFVEMDDPGLTVWPAHRLVDGIGQKSLKEWEDLLGDAFDVSEANVTMGSQFAAMIEEEPGCVIGLATREGVRLLRLKDEVDRAAFLGDDQPPEWRALDVAVLHRGILGNLLGIEEGAELVYQPDADAVLDAAGKGEVDAAFFLKAIPPQQIRNVADAGCYMPEKATYFFPKLPSGAVIYRNKAE